MKSLLLAAALVLGVPSAHAAPTPPKTKINVLVGPEQPIPYRRLEDYRRAPPKARATQDWWTIGVFAQIGEPTDAAAKVPAGGPAAPKR